MGSPPSVSTSAGGGLVVRSTVPPGRKYPEYREFLRWDFLNSCAYCSISEAEARAINFTIDHYEARSARSDLANSYENLMYCCNWCNVLKGDRYPPQAARSAGHRFFRCDEDKFDDHFQLDGIALASRSKTGEYTIHAIALNRGQLRRLRELRQRLQSCHDEVAQGVLGLRKVKIDQLPPPIRSRVLALVRRAQDTSDRIQTEIDDILRDHAKSPFLDLRAETDEERKTREAALKSIQGLFEGNWRGRDQKIRSANP